jgi:Ca2+-binding RTX toxin-like protein
LSGQDGDDEIRGLGGSDDIYHGSGDDVIYGGDGDDLVFPDEGNDVIYGGDGNDVLDSQDDEQRDKLVCGAGRDKYVADKNDYVDSSCETVPASAKASGSVSADPCNVAPGCGHDVVGLTSSASPTPVPLGGTGGPAIVLPAALLLGSGSILTYAILRRR